MIWYVNFKWVLNFIMCYMTMVHIEINKNVLWFGKKHLVWYSFINSANKLKSITSRRKQTCVIQSHTDVCERHESELNHTVFLNCKCSTYFAIFHWCENLSWLHIHITAQSRALFMYKIPSGVETLTLLLRINVYSAIFILSWKSTTWLNTPCLGIFEGKMDYIEFCWFPEKILFSPL